MFLADCLGVNELGHLTIGGADAIDLAREFGTPLYVLDETQVRQNCRAYKEAIAKFYGGHGLPLYASKALSCKALCRIAQEEGMGLDVVSAGELYTALQAGFDPANIYFHGNNKTRFELEYALRERVGFIVVDNLTELETLSGLAAGRPVDILLRIKPGIDAHTHQFIRTGQIDSKFGFALETGEAFEAARMAAAAPNLRLVGVHCHVGSQIFDVAPFELAADVLLRFMAQIKSELGITLTQLNLGGGIGIFYDETDDALPYGVYFEKVAALLKERCAALDLPLPLLLLEPGRSIPGPAGVTLYTVGAVKEIPGIRTYVTVDGGMGDNPRYMMYGANYTVLCANRAAQPRTETVTVAGRYCESGDLIQEHTKLQATAPGDILAVLATGAYNYSMASNYNRVPKPPMVMITEGRPRIIVRGETIEDMARLDC
ncbi:MAG: diaminopimelate decarboxylase [Oscillospiraceae bacterium]|jgi:diaminopimelate decarboxylase|nr:diaminopimelate decarboxylase [Oscillospiraceae bacterium]